MACGRVVSGVQPPVAVLSRPPPPPTHTLQPIAPFAVALGGVPVAVYGLSEGLAQSLKGRIKDDESDTGGGRQGGGQGLTCIGGDCRPQGWRH